MQSMAPRPLSSLLSFALVAFTIEFDNEAELRLPHRTTDFGSSSAMGVWLGSMVLWFNCMRWVPEEEIAVREVELRARTVTNWDGMRRWGYIYFAPDPNDNRPKPPQSALLVRPTTRGRTAAQLWAELIPAIEERWRKRFGEKAIDALRSALVAVAQQFDLELPDCMPILKFGLVTPPPVAAKRESAPDRTGLPELPLPALLARVLVAFALEFERESDVSLAICADVLRVVDEKGTPVRELPVLGGVSKEAVAMAIGFLSKRGYAVVQTKAREKILLLRPKGVEARATYQRSLSAIESRWRARYGKKAIDQLNGALDRIAGDGTAEGSPLFAGLEPSPEGWRARVRSPKTLPHYPMVLHRGGYPDGS